MRVIFQVSTGPSEGRKVPLQVGEIARFGRGERADVCIAGDETMSEVHFEVECRSDHCLVRDLQSAGGTLLNDQPLTESPLTTGDVIIAGQTRLVTQVEGGPSATQVEPDLADAEPEEAAEPKTTAEICAPLELEEESLALLQPEHTPEDFVDLLVQHRQFADAIQVLSSFLEKRAAIWWAYQCVQDILGDSLSPVDQTALDSTLAWMKDPTDEHRRAAMKVAEENEFETPPCWVAASAFWSEGSLAPAELPVVEPDEALTGQGVTATLMLVANQGDPLRIDDRYEKIMQTGKSVVTGELSPPDPESDA